MHRRAFTALAAAAVATGALSVPAADAATLEQLINAHPQFTFEDDSAEGLGVDANNNNRLDVGDTLRGVISFQSFIAQPSGTTFPLDGATNDAVHGLFEIRASQKTTAPGGGFTYRFEPYAPFAAEVGGVPNAMIGLWTSGTRLNPYACGTISACEAGATAGGDPKLVLGFEEGKQNIWGAGPLPTDDINAARGVSFGSPIGEGYGLRINVLSDDLDVLPFIDLTDTSIIAGQAFNFPAEVIGSGNVLGSARINSEFPTFDDADIQMAVVPVPAALPLFLAGLGALGMIGWRRNAV